MFLTKGENSMKTINCKKCDDTERVEKEVSKVTCSKCCATLGMKK
tara:strand:+ start:38 stop:172 length:135 start_codon:yes stop_codon:yes gene_type:complete